MIPIAIIIAIIDISYPAMILRTACARASRPSNIKTMSYHDSTYHVGNIKTMSRLRPATIPGCDSLRWQWCALNL